MSSWWTGVPRDQWSKAVEERKFEGGTALVPRNHLVPHEFDDAKAERARDKARRLHLMKIGFEMPPGVEVE
jgi:hypothetical protein